MGTKIVMAREEKWRSLQLHSSMLVHQDFAFPIRRCEGLDKTRVRCPSQVGFTGRDFFQAYYSSPVSSRRTHGSASTSLEALVSCPPHRSQILRVLLLVADAMPQLGWPGVSAAKEYADTRIRVYCSE